MLSRCFLNVSVSVGALVIRLSQISSLLFYVLFKPLHAALEEIQMRRYSYEIHNSGSHYMFIVYVTCNNCYTH